MTQTSGLIPREYRDHRRYSYQRTFGAAQVLHDLDLDAGLTNFDQNKVNPVFKNGPYPNGCSGYTAADIATDADKIVYDPGFNYEMTLLMDNLPQDAPCTLQASMKAPVVYGLHAEGEPEELALNHRRGPYFEVDQIPGLDWFDSFWSAMQTGGRSISVGTPWYLELTNAKKGIVDDVFIRDTPFWHAWKACGVKTINGKPYLKVKAWVGPKKGDKGFYYFSRETVNKLMAVKGTDALTNSKATPGDIRVVQLTIQQTVISYMYRLLKLLKA